MKVLVTGSNGLCGSAIKRLANGYDHDFYFSTRQCTDLLNKEAVDNLFRKERPSCVIHTSAKVGGLGMNAAIPYTLCSENLTMNQNIVDACLKYDVNQLMAFSSICVFPDGLSLLKEEDMHEGPVFAGNAGYGYSKRMLDHMFSAVKQQYGDKNWTSIIPGNLFGFNDLWGIEYSHIVPTVIYKIYKAKQNQLSGNGDTSVQLWGDGASKREFICSNDLAQILLESIGRELPQRVIISGRKEISIREMVDILVDVSGFTGKVIWDTSKPNGQRSRPTSKAVIDGLFPDFQYTDIDISLRDTYNWFVDNYPNVRMEY
jgi:GDP-L-fucose synthase